MHVLPRRPSELARITSLVFLGAIAIFATSVAMPTLLRLPDPRPGCDAPLRYRLGEVDPRFPLGERTFRRTVFEAESIWESAIGRDILRYDPAGELIVTTEFDERQMMTYDSRALESRIAEYEKTAETLSGRYDALKSRYDRDASALERRIADFEDALRVYNRDVAQINARGGATEEEFEELEDVREDLEDEQESIRDETDRLNGIIADINALSERLSTETAVVNEHVASFRETYGEPQPFVQGLYRSEDPSITIYQFEREEDLRLVLAHEFGHALGIDEHVEDDSTALMYYLMDGQDIVNPTLAPGDIAAYAIACPARTPSRREALVRYLITTPRADIRFSRLSLLLFGAYGSDENFPSLSSS